MNFFSKIALKHDFIRNKNNTRPRLAMAFMVRDEVDILPINILYHSFLGVEKFYVTDNCSYDGTREKLDELAKTYPIEIYDDKDLLTFNQASNMTKMAKQALKDGFDWIVSNDADEFWFPKSGNLADLVDMKRASVRIKRVNVLPQENISSVFLSEYITKNSIYYPKSTTYPDYANYTLTDLGYKSMVNLHGLERIRHGNHDVNHIALKKFTQLSSIPKSEAVIYHYPIREYDLFEQRIKKIHDRSLIAESNKMKRMGSQGLYWLQAYRSGDLKKVYDSMVFNSSQLSVLECIHVVERCSDIKSHIDLLKKAMSCL